MFPQIVPGVIAVLLTAGSLIVTKEQPGCHLDVRAAAASPNGRQVRVVVKMHPGCPPDQRIVMRFRTANGGVLPLSGLVMYPDFPPEISFWLTKARVGRPGPAVEQLINGRWKIVWRLAS